MVEREKNVMIIDAGSRGPAIAQNIREHSPQVREIVLVPGNAGTDFIDGAHNLDVDVANHRQVVEAARDIEADLVIIAPEEPLVNGIVDHLKKAGVGAFGPKYEAARLEGDKIFSSEKLQQWGVPIPAYYAPTDRDDAHRYIDEYPDNGLVVKYPFLAAGKGVRVTSSRDESHQAVDDLEKTYGPELLFQEKLRGVEMSVMAIVSGERYVFVPTSEDHKQVWDGDQGPNTGGMGGVAPHPLIAKQKIARIESEILVPMLSGMKKDGIEFVGILYPALFWTTEGPKVIEVNCRFGGSEWEAISRLVGFDTFKIFSDAVKGRLEPNDVKFKAGSAVSVALASKGYPGPYKKGMEINGLDKKYENVVVFHAGTKKEDGKYLTNGGRVVFVTGVGGDVYEAREHAYRAIGKNGVNFEGMQYRSDIGIRNRDE